MRFLIDECLSFGLVAVANEAGYEAHHVAHLSLAGAGDPHLVALVLEGDFTFVTANAGDFLKLYRSLSLHAGLILILGQYPRGEQQRIFRELLLRIAGEELVNTVVEVAIRGTVVETGFFDLPRQS